MLFQKRGGVVCSSWVNQLILLQAMELKETSELRTLLGEEE